MVTVLRCVPGCAELVRGPRSFKGASAVYGESSRSSDQHGYMVLANSLWEDAHCLGIAS